MKLKLFAAFAIATTLFSSIPASAQIVSVDVTGGKVQGTTEGDIGVFKGIPFAAPPVGDLRWADPQPVKPWKGVKQATAFAPACMQQLSALTMFGGEPKMSEDCLYLNVWTPAKGAGEKLPVMVWIYGGGFNGGATSIPAYNGTEFAKHGVVLVSIAYRVGPFGFLAHPELSKQQGGTSGDYGLRDQIAGLKWVRDNISKFGGDPGNVTIFGESAGGISVAMLSQSPLAKGLFAKAISESGGSFAAPGSANAVGRSTFALAAAETQGVKSIKGIGASSIAEARKLPADAIMKVQGSSWPIYDGKVLPGDPWQLYDEGKFNDTPILVGTNSDEGSAFIRQPIEPEAYAANIRKQYGPFAQWALAAYPAGDNPEEARQSQADIMRDTAFGWPTFSWARKQSANGKGAAYVYYFDHKTKETPHGSLHGSEIRFVFDTLQSTGGIANPTGADRKMSEQMMGYWVNFARTGNPNGPGLPDWPRFSARRPLYMELGDHFRPIAVANFAQYEFWDAYYASLREKR